MNHKKDGFGNDLVSGEFVNVEPAKFEIDDDGFFTGKLVDDWDRFDGYCEELGGGVDVE